MTLAGAEALGLQAETGSLEPGKAADVVYLRPPIDSPLAFSLEEKEDASGVLAALLTQAGPETVRWVRVEGMLVRES